MSVLPISRFSIRNGKNIFFYEDCYILMIVGGFYTVSLRSVDQLLSAEPKSMLKLRGDTAWAWIRILSHGTSWYGFQM